MRRGYYQPSGIDAIVMRKDLLREMTDGPLVLGIETSCDETGVGIVRGTDCSPTRWRRRWTSTPGTAAWCPRWPAGRTWRRWSPSRGRLRKAGVRPSDIDAVAVTAGPGLAGALLVGVAAAKAYAYALGKPLYGVNHLAAHVSVDQLEHGPLPAPAMALLVSGGHSSLLLVPDVTCDVRPLGATIDDAAGEAFDKVARVLGLAFPGGPPIDRAARDGDPARSGSRAPAARRHARLLLRRPEDRRRALGGGPPGRRASRCRSPTWPPPSRKRSPTC